MPRHLSEAQRARAIAKLEENWSLTEVAAELNVSKSCIFYIKKRWQGEQRLQRTIRQGIGKVSTENEDNTLVEFINHNPFETAVKAREETLFPGSLRTTQRRLKQCGFKNCVATHKMLLTEEHKQRRVQFANEFLQGNEFWNNVMFSDEKTPTNRDQLWESIENAWEELVDSYDMRTLIASMPRRLENIVASNGCAIKY
ncbi:hypothetical protein NQ318_005677 [Aromia moschata]|uniref:Transposase Tc1-like domain-containing protein n=1 Tax=Aromia moschata TaxID=1265417 RepID=A0AAV8XDT4_9CUCU|nr:hypothetical protein NQ318_005677 [Aromia moschata]